MEQLQTFDDDIVNLILSYSLLDLSAPERLTADEVYAAAELAVQISTLEGAGLAARRPLPGATAPAPARNPPARETQAPARRQEAAATRGGVIGADERREILVDSDDSETETEAEGEVCIACAGGAGEKRRLACECNYCAPCLRRCIRTGLRNEESWPPRCHERLTEQDIRWTRRPGLLRLWSQLAVEWDSPAPERVYCSRSECAAFIPRAGGEAGEVRCGACGEGTCGGCRRPWHPGLPCAEEEEEEELMDMMDEYGYASCNNCRRIVDLRDGCNHMTCGCGHQFCYLCGERWKTCTCPRHGFGHGRERRQQYRQGHDNIPFIPQAPDPDAFFADPPPLEFVAPPREGEGGAEREQLPGGALVPPPADVEWFPPAQLPEGGAARNGNGNGELIFIDDGTQPRIPGTQYIYDWEVYPGREPWVRRHPAGHPGDHGPEATVQTRWLAEGERVPQDAMPQGGNDNMVFLPQVYSSDEYDSEEEFEEERRRRARRRRRDRRGRHREEPRRAPEPRRVPEPRQVPEPRRAPEPQTRYDITFTQNHRPRIRETTCAHNLPTQWTPSRAANPPCSHCRGAHRSRELWRCVGCGVQACRRHMARFGLGRREAEREVEELQRRMRGLGVGFASFLGVGGLF